MAAVISAGDTGATGSHVTTGPSQVTVSGVFNGGAVEITCSADTLRSAPVVSFNTPGCVSLQTAVGVTLTATVVGGSTPSVDVSII